MTQANGSQLDFSSTTPQGATEPVGPTGKTWCPSDATTGVWCPTAPRYFATLSGAPGGTGGTWTFVDGRKSPTTYSFTSAGALSEISDANGDTLIELARTPQGSGQAACPSGDTCSAWASTPAGETSPAATLVEAFNSNAPVGLGLRRRLWCGLEPGHLIFLLRIGLLDLGSNPVDLFGHRSGWADNHLHLRHGEVNPYQYDETTMNSPATGQVTNTYDSSVGSPSR